MTTHVGKATPVAFLCTYCRVVEYKKVLHGFQHPYSDDFCAKLRKAFSTLSRVRLASALVEQTGKDFLKFRKLVRINVQLNPFSMDNNSRFSRRQVK